MKTVAFAIQKGGVGKTSLSGNLAYLTARKKKTLLVDADPQGSLSSWLLTESPPHELAQVLQGEIDLGKVIVGLVDNLDLLPTFGIGGGLLAYGDKGLEKEPFIFQDLRQQLEDLEYELVIYDTHPGSTRLERSVLLGCDEVITPITPEYLSLDGIEIFKGFLQTDIRKGYRGLVRHEKIVLNLINQSFRRHRIYQERARDLGYQLFEVGQDAQLAEAQIVHQSILDYAPHSRIIPELERLAIAVTNGGRS